MGWGLFIMNKEIVKTITTDINNIVSLADLKQHLFIDFTADDSLIESYRAAAIDYCENYTGKRLIERQYKITDTADDKGNIKLYDIPIQSIDEIKIGDETVDTYKLENQTNILSKISGLLSGREYTITYTSGYKPDDIPPVLIHAIKLIVGTYYTQRSDILFNRGIDTKAADRLLNLGSIC